MDAKKILLTLLLIWPSFVFAAAFSLSSPLSSQGKTPIFIELFTSQGCSSCPPAEEYINTFIKNDRLWQKYIPVVFHVDYWDYIGWKDVFAQPAFSHRQRRYSTLRHVRTVYTPAFVVNGVAWRRGFFHTYPDSAGLNNGLLKLSLDKNKVTASFKKSAEVGNKLNLNVAILGMGMVVNILAGENKGRTARHHFVVLGYTQQLSNTRNWKIELPVIKKTDSQRYALVAWVSKPDDPTPLQAVADWLNKD